MVVAVSLAVALLGSWALSTDVHEVPYTDYNYVTDLDGLFETTKAPEYIEYNPSSNYTGYYTDESIVNGKKYFDGADFDRSNRANNFSVTLKPDFEIDSTVSLDTYTVMDPFDGDEILLRYMEGSGNYFFYTNDATSVTLTDYISAMGLSDDINQVVIKSLSDFDSSDIIRGQPLVFDWILFTIKDAWFTDSGRTVCAIAPLEWFESQGVAPGYNPNKGMVNLPLVSCKVDLDENTVTLYTDKDCQNQYGIYSLSDVIMSYGGDANNNIKMEFGDSAVIQAANLETYYMDPSKGVKLE